MEITPPGKVQKGENQFSKVMKLTKFGKGIIVLVFAGAFLLLQPLMLKCLGSKLTQ
jgi:hypothetical protein